MCLRAQTVAHPVEPLLLHSGIVETLLTSAEQQEQLKWKNVSDPIVQKSLKCFDVGSKFIPCSHSGPALC